jgi:uncharacterized protein
MRATILSGLILLPLAAAAQAAVPATPPPVPAIPPGASPVPVPPAEIAPPLRPSPPSAPPASPPGTALPRPGPAGMTLLRLSETAAVPARPDEIDATLRAEATGASAQDVQSVVNAAASEALSQAHQAKGVQVGTGFYRVWHQTQPRDQWQASQSIELRSHDGAALLSLVGALQTKGLAVDQLGWRLSDDLARKSRADATRQAVLALRGRAEDVAGLLNMRFGGFREVRLDPERPVPGARMLMAAAAPSGPSAEETDVQVSATVEADVTLLPR